MNIIDKIRSLETLLGSHVPVYRTERRWWRRMAGIERWLYITNEEDHYSVMVTTDRDSHDPTQGNALAADFNKVTGELCPHMGMPAVWESAISMWPVRNEAHAQVVKAQVEDYIERAHVYHAQAVVS